jgi:HEAT repeat protein
MLPRMNKRRTMSPNNHSNQDISHHIDLLAGDRPTCMHAVQALAQIGIPAIPALLQAMHDPDRWFAAAEALTAIGQPAIQPLIDLMREPPFGNFAFHALTNMGTIAVPAFIAALSDSDDEVRMWAATAFEVDPTNDAYDALVAVLDDPDVVVRATVIRAIGKLDRREILPQLQKMQHSEQDSAIQQALDEAVRHLSSIA